jgi:predicted AAA+ superfamily ATPase
MQPEVFDSQLQFPGTLCLYGASQAGKSTFVLNLLKNKSLVFRNQPIEHIFYVYSSYVYSSYRKRIDTNKNTHTHILQKIPFASEAGRKVLLSREKREMCIVRCYTTCVV